MQKFATVYFPQVGLEKINAFREKYDPNREIIAPHITIVSPISGISEIQLTQHLGNITKGVKPFPIRLIGLTKTPDHLFFYQLQQVTKR